METMMMQSERRRLPEFYVQNTSNPSANNMSFFIEDYDRFSSISPPAATVSFTAQSPIVGQDLNLELSPCSRVFLKKRNERIFKKINKSVFSSFLGNKRKRFWKGPPLDMKPLSSWWRKRRGGESHSTAVERQNTAEMREMLFKISAMQPVNHDVDPESVKPPKRRNVRISKDPQSVAARRRRERISERIRVLQRLVPGGTQMDTASMLDEAIHYMKFLKKQIESMEKADVNGGAAVAGMDFPVSIGSGSSVVVLPWEHQQSVNYL
ncbi:hypothetical protein OSB04_005132, partial [Centaurea solstitialis]